MLFFSSVSTSSALYLSVFIGIVRMKIRHVVQKKYHHLVLSGRRQQTVVLGY